MQDIKVINGSAVQNLITKFYYKQNQLCFQILLHLGLDETIPYSEFSDYKTYKQVYSKLLQMKNSNAPIEIKKKVEQISYSSQL